MKWRIVTDSSSDIFELDRKNEDIEYTSVPFMISADDITYIDDENINILELIGAMTTSKTTCRTACPSPQAFFEEFKKEGNVLATTISKELSGSYNSANTAIHMLKEEEPDKNVAVINSISTGTGVILVIEKMQELIEEGKDFDEVVSLTEHDVHHHRTIFALCSFNNLVRNGRVSKLAAFAAGKLKLWGIGIGTDEGKIEIKSKVRGKKRAIDAIVQDFLEHNVTEGKFYISHCMNEEFANELRDKILEVAPNMKIKIFTTRGLDSFYAENMGVIVTYEF